MSLGLVLRPPPFYQWWRRLGGSLSTGSGATTRANGNANNNLNITNQSACNTSLQTPKALPLSVILSVCLALSPASLSGFQRQKENNEPSSLMHSNMLLTRLDPIGFELKSCEITTTPTTSQYTWWINLCEYPFVCARECLWLRERAGYCMWEARALSAQWKVSS